MSQLVQNGNGYIPESSTNSIVHLIIKIYAIVQGEMKYHGKQTHNLIANPNNGRRRLVAPSFARRGACRRAPDTRSDTNAGWKVHKREQTAH
jgi:hypothetical protein